MILASCDAGGVPKKRALVSVSDKTDLHKLAKGLTGTDKLLHYETCHLTNAARHAFASHPPSKPKLTTSEGC